MLGTGRLGRFLRDRLIHHDDILFAGQFLEEPSERSHNFLGGLIEGFGIYLLKGLAGGCGMGSMAVARLHVGQGHQRDAERSLAQACHRQS